MGPSWILISTKGDKLGAQQGPPNTLTWAGSQSSSARSEGLDSGNSSSGNIPLPRSMGWFTDSLEVQILFIPDHSRLITSELHCGTPPSPHPLYFGVAHPMVMASCMELQSFGTTRSGILQERCELLHFCSLSSSSSELNLSASLQTGSVSRTGFKETSDSK